MNATIVNTSGENHTAQADLRSARIARAPTFTGIPMTGEGEEGEGEIAAVGTEVGKKEKKGNRIT